MGILVKSIHITNYYSPVGSFASALCVICLFFTLLHCRRDPEFCAKPPKNSSVEEQNRYNEELQKNKPVASRYLYLIRHGQYNLQGESDKECYLTELGEFQCC